MIEIKKHGVLLEKTNNSFEKDGVLNPAAIKVGNTIHMFYRAVAKNNYSTIGYCKLSSPLEVEYRNTSPLFIPDAKHECHGLEDPRIVEIEGTYYLTYTAYDGVNALGALATSKDLVNWKKHGIVVPKISYQEFNILIEEKGSINEKYKRYNDYQNSSEIKKRNVFIWNKNFMFFPRKINNAFCFLHRIKPDIQIVKTMEKLEDLDTNFWGDYFHDFKKNIVLAPMHQHEASYIGGGCPPIETKDGWLLIYHSVHDTVEGYVYSACAALLDLNNPQKEISRLPYPLFKPEKEWELQGEVDNVCFPTAAILDGNTLYIYYGAADERIAVVSLSLSDLLAELALNEVKKYDNE